MVEGATEPGLVARLRGGDPSAFDEVYQAYRPRIFSFLARLSGRREVAEDLSQETWIRLATRAQTLRPDTHLAAWLFTVARNLFISHCRSRQTDALRTGEMGCLSLPAHAHESPFEQAAASELAARLERALARLPVTCREVLLLVGTEGLTPAEAAVVLGVTPEAARQRLARGRALLATRLGSGRAAPAAQPPGGET
jgi:RNA polymerase sigma-70 factor (ECF subfamily)